VSQDVQLSGIKSDHESEEAAEQETEHYRGKLAHQQALLYAQRKNSVLCWWGQLSPNRRNAEA
jgi:hypothetical protein